MNFTHPVSYVFISVQQQTSTFKMIFSSSNPNPNPLAIQWRFWSPTRDRNTLKCDASDNKYTCLWKIPETAWIMHNGYIIYLMITEETNQPHPPITSSDQWRFKGVYQPENKVCYSRNKLQTPNVSAWFGLTVHHSSISLGVHEGLEPRQAARLFCKASGHRTEKTRR